MKQLILSTLSILILASVATLPVRAAGQPGAVSVSPAIQQLRLRPGEDSADFPVQIRNGTTTALQATVSFTDFKALNQSGGVAFIGQTAQSLEHKHGLVNWVRLGSEQFGLDPGEKATITVHLEKLQSLPPGGHYGAVTYTVVPESPGVMGNHVQFNQVLTTLLFITTADGGTEHLTMLPPSGIGLVRTSLPRTIDLFFKNDGNTQTSPRGQVSIYGSSAGKPVATAVVNPGSALALPDSIRQLPTPITSMKHIWWPHRYHVLIKYRPDGVKTFSSYRTDFWYLPPVFFPIAIVILWFALKMRQGWRKRKAKAAGAAKASHKQRSRLGRTLHTLRVESILVWRDLKLLVRWLLRKSKKQGPRPPSTAAKK